MDYGDFISTNIFGGFLVTQRMLAMYKKRKRIKIMSANLSAVLHLISGVLFILALRVCHLLKHQGRETFLE